MIIGILGKKYHGKDTVANYIKESREIVHLSYAEPLKEACRILFSFNDDQLYGDKKEVEDEFWNITPRQVYKFIGTDLCRKQMKQIIPHVNEDFWVECMRRRLETINKDIVISDVRFPNEAKLIKEKGGIIIKVSRPLIEDNDEHESESLVDYIEYDYAINNSGTLIELKFKTHIILSQIFND